MSKYLIFGGTGSLGKKLIERLLPEHEVHVFSRDEAKHWTIQNEFSNSEHKNKLKFFVGDIRDKRRIVDVIRQSNPEIIIIAAALKQVVTCELSPSESIATNVTGTQNVIDAISEVKQQNLKKVLFVSTDKACSPVNVYGMCKSISERIVTSSHQTGLPDVKYLAVRYGNVLESRGSIIPLFKYQSEHLDQITVTDPEMTRFVMTLDDSVNLIKFALDLGSSGNTYIPALSAMRIGDLAEIFAESSGKTIKIVGPRPGEKKHEDLINESESLRTTFFDDHVYVVGPASDANNRETSFTISSSRYVLSKSELKENLEKLQIINKPSCEFSGLKIEEINTNENLSTF